MKLQVDYVLERNELRSIFSTKGRWDVKVDEIRMDGDHGRGIQSFIATRI